MSTTSSKMIISQSNNKAVMAVADVLTGDAVTHQMQHLGLDGLPCAPEQVVGNVMDSLPALDIGEALHPAGAKQAVETVVPVIGEEGGHVDAVGNVIHGVFRRVDLRPEGRADIGRDIAMDAGNAVVVA